MYKEGTFLFALAGAYGRFDTLRVADNSAHQAVAVARMQALSTLDKSKQTAFQESLKATLGNPEGLAAACKEIVRIGPPNYYPRYMIQHGMGAFLKGGAVMAWPKTSMRRPHGNSRLTPICIVRVFNHPHAKSDIRGLVTTLLVSVGYLPRSRDEHLLQAPNVFEGCTNTGAASLPIARVCVGSVCSAIPG